MHNIRNLFKSLSKYFNQIEINAFIVCSGIMFATYFAGGLLVINNKNISLFEVLIYHRNVVSRLTRYEVMNSQFSDWYHFILPILLSMPTVMLLTDGINNKTYRLFLIRENVKSYYKHTYATAILSAFFMVVLTTLIFCSFVCVFFPEFKNYGTLNIINHGEEQYLTIYLQKIQFELVYVFFITSLSYLIAVTLVNKYSAITLVFLINYLLEEYIYDFNIIILLVLTLFIKDMSYIILRWRCIN